jgi:type IV pilus assembly protein PilQ
MAMAQLTQLDIRRRQVVVNVKIIDVNLNNTQDYNTSFSFGLGNNYFSSDGGAATFNFGGSRPATSAEVSNSVTSTPVITNPITGTPFLNPNQSTTIQGGGSGTTVINQSQFNYTAPNGVVVAPGTVYTTPNTNATVYQAVSPASSNALNTGFSAITQATNNIITVAANGTATVTQGTAGSATAALSSLYQFPKRLLTSLQAQVTQGNAKILTDPTLIVQEGQQALVNLTQEVVGNITLQTTDTSGGSRTEQKIDKQKVGLTLSVKIERIDDNGFVSLSVAPTVSAPTASQSTGNGTITLVSERSLTSGLIRLRDGQTLILSGIIQDQDRTTITKMPILGDLPLIGALFRSTNRNNQRNEVVVLLTPQIMDDSENSSYGYNYNPSPEVRQILERRGLKLPSPSK